MSRYPAYPEYKDSGVAWLGEIPVEWKVKPIRYIARKVYTGGTPSTKETDYFSDGNSNWFTPGDFWDSLELKSSERKVNELAIQDGAVKTFPAGTVFVVGIGTIGRIGYCLFASSANQQINAIIPSENVITEFLAYSLSSQTEQMVAVSNATILGIMNQEKTKQIRIALPPLDEQRTIARFLDAKTTQIDALIAKKAALLAALAEQRTALISHAVTRGLDPGAPMKDSGVAWLGEIPAGWEVIRIRYCSDFVTSGSRGWSQYFSDGGNIFLRIANVSRDFIDLKLDDIQRVSPPNGAEGQRTIVHAGDVIVSITADLGSVSVIPDNFEMAYVSQHLALIRPTKTKIESRWLAYQLFSSAGKAQLLGSGYGGTKIQLGLNDIKDLLLTFPPIREQQAIVYFLDEQIAKIDKQRGKIQQAIDALREYRTAMITNAVTGKIDVRGVAVR